jgi:hypothetical protein
VINGAGIFQSEFTCHEASLSGRPKPSIQKSTNVRDPVMLSQSR